jgi:hypothetical protein
MYAGLGKMDHRLIGWGWMVCTLTEVPLAHCIVARLTARATAATS